MKDKFNISNKFNLLLCPGVTIAGLFFSFFKGTAMQIEKVLINDHLCVSKVS